MPEEITDIIETEESIDTSLYQYAEDLPVETSETLDGTEKFIMFDTESGKQVTLSDILTYIKQHFDD